MENIKKCKYDRWGDEITVEKAPGHVYGRYIVTTIRDGVEISLIDKNDEMFDCIDSPVRLRQVEAQKYYQGKINTKAGIKIVKSGKRKGKPMQFGRDGTRIK